MSASRMKNASHLRIAKPGRVPFPPVQGTSMTSPTSRAAPRECHPSSTGKDYPGTIGAKPNQASRRAFVGFFATATGTTGADLRKHLLDHRAMYVGQAMVPSLELERQTLVVDAQAMQDRRVQ